MLSYVRLQFVFVLFGSAPWGGWGEDGHATTDVTTSCYRRSIEEAGLVLFCLAELLARDGRAFRTGKLTFCRLIRISKVISGRSIRHLSSTIIINRLFDSDTYPSHLTTSSLRSYTVE